MPGALHDLRVIDFTHALNGPFCTMLLGHLGAEIIKIEPPAGDRFRRSWMPPRDTQDAYEFLWINVNKKSVVLNLKTERGIDLARQLIARADVLVENYQQGTMERFGLDYDSLKSLNPRLIYACSRGYGEWGPYAACGNTAQSNNSMTGWTHTAWKYSGAQGTKALGIGDEAAGVSMALGILAALHARERTGAGQKIVVSMQEAVLGFMISSMHEYFTGNDVGNSPIQVADGYFTLRMPEMSEAVWAQLARLIGQSDLLNDPRFTSVAERRQHRAELEKIVKEWARHKTRQEIWDALRDLDYFGAPVLSTSEVLEDPHIKARQAFIERKHPTAGRITLLAPWIHLSKTPASIHDDAPAIGQHTDEVLGKLLSLTAAELGELRAQAVIK
ncbi:MAG TPA: CoA transferase [Candidatus Binatia bacterium]|nr:CoA transferase [Candidatus Binatia bacterium]